MKNVLESRVSARCRVGFNNITFAVAWSLAAIILPQFAEAEDSAKLTPRIAVLPSLSELGSHGHLRWWLGGFDAALQAELLENYDVVMLSRAGLSNIVFEQKIAVASGKSDLPPQVPAADYLIFSILDSKRRELRMHVMKVSDGMKFTPARIIKYGDYRKLGGPFAKRVARELGKQLRLETAKKIEVKPATEEEAKKPALKVALLNPIAARSVKASIAQLAPVMRTNLEIALAAAPFPVELVERERVDALMAELALGESGAAEANSAARFGTLVGADLILMPYIHPASDKNIHVTVLAIESGHGRIVAGRSWTGGALDAPPDSFLAALSTDALNRRASAIREWPGEAAMRIAEAGFLTKMPNASIGLRLPLVVEAELCLMWADAALALSHDNRDVMRNAAGLINKALPFCDQLEMKYHSQRAWVAEYKQALESGSIDHIRSQARRIFSMPLMELTTDGNFIDLGRAMKLHYRTGNPHAAIALAESQSQPLDELLNFFYFRSCYAKTLIELGRFEECAELLHNEPYKDLQYGAFYLRQDAYRAVGDTQREFDSLWRNARDHMKDYRETDVSRLFEIAPDYVPAEWVLAAYSFYADDWKRDSPLIRESLVRLRIKAEQTKRAISDAQCAYLSYKLEKDKKGMHRMTAVLKELDSKPLETLPRAAEFIRFLPGTRIDLIHDSGVPAKRATATAQLIANQWGCEVHVIPLSFDITRLSTYRELVRSVNGRELADCLYFASRADDPLLQTIVLTSSKLHWGSPGNGSADIFGASTPFGATSVVSTYYFDRFSTVKKRPVEEDLVIACSLSMVSIELQRRAKKVAGRAERFVPMPPDMLATSANLTLGHRLPGVSPDTGRRMAEVEPEEWRRAAIEGRNNVFKRLEASPPPNADDFRALATKVSNASITIIQPEK